VHIVGHTYPRARQAHVHGRAVPQNTRGLTERNQASVGAGRRGGRRVWCGVHVCVCLQCFVSFFRCSPEVVVAELGCVPLKAIDAECAVELRHRILHDGQARDIT
jgi:hypothetical protein